MAGIELVAGREGWQVGSRLLSDDALLEARDAGETGAEETAQGPVSKPPAEGEPAHAPAPADSQARGRAAADSEATERGAARWPWLLAAAGVAAVVFAVLAGRAIRRRAGRG